MANGQGCPKDEGRAFLSWREHAFALRLLVAIGGSANALRVLACVLCLYSSGVAQVPAEPIATKGDPSDSIQTEIRVVWGGPVARSFDGTISIDSGRIRPTRNLNMQADSVAKFRSRSPQQVQLVPHFPGVFGGVDLAVSGSAGSILTIEIKDPATGKLVIHTVTLSQLLQGNWSQSLDERGTRVAIERQMYDRIRIKANRAANIFNVGEAWHIEVSGFQTGLTLGEYVVQARFVDAAYATQDVFESRVQVDANGNFPPTIIDMFVPDREGGYQLEVSLHRHRMINSFVSPSPAITRRIDLVTFDPEAISPAIESWQPIATINALSASKPGSLSWLPSVDMPQIQLPGATEVRSRLQQYNPLANSLNKPLSYGVLGSRELPDDISTESALERCLSLAPKAWLAIPLNNLDSGVPYRIRVQMPADQPMHLAFSVRQKDVVGEFSGLNPDSAVEIGSRRRTTSAKTASHDVVFWPDGSEAYALIANADSELDASVLTVTVERGEMSGRVLGVDSEGRQSGVFFDKPLLADAFNASRQIDELTGRAFEGWQTWHDAITRLGVYMSSVEANTLMLNVFTDGGAIFPSEVLSPTSRFDSGTFFSDGRSPDVKDVVELLLRHADRDGRKVVLGIDLDTELPGLTRWYGDQSASQEIFQLNVDGSQAAVGMPSKRPRYNPLDARVRAEFAAVVSDIAKRYSHHPSFAGLAMHLDQKSQLLFAGDRWGYDAKALRDYELHTQARLPDADLETVFRQSSIRHAFLAWRASEITGMFEMLSKELTNSNPALRLYLNTAQLWSDAPLQEDFFYPQNAVRNPTDYLLGYGISTEELARLPSVEMMRGNFDSQLESVDSQDWIRQIAGDRVLQSIPSNEKTQVLMHQAARGLEIANDDENEAELSAAWMYPQSSGYGSFAAKSLIEQIYESDPLLLLTGGWIPQFGQEAATRSLYRAFRALPPTALATYPMKDSDSNLRIRTGQHGEKSYAQLVNNAPWPERVALVVDYPADAEVRVLGDAAKQFAIAEEAKRNLSGMRTWLFEIGPYEMIAVEVGKPGLQVAEVQHAAKPEDLVSIGQELQELETVITHAADPTQRRPLANVSGDFESWIQDSRPASWNVSSMPQVNIGPSDEFPHSGLRSLLIESRSSNDVSAWIQSRGFTPPKTGRLSVDVWLRTSAAAKPMLVRVSILGRLRNGSRFERSQQFGGLSPSRQKLPVDWGRKPIQLAVGSIPTEEIDELYVAIDLIGPGRVWVDDVQVFESYLQPDERIQLRGQLLVAKQRLAEGNPFPAEQLLDSHWGRYLSTFQEPHDRETVQPTATGNSGSNYNSASQWNSTAPLLQRWRNSFRQRWQR